MKKIAILLCLSYSTISTAAPDFKKTGFTGLTKCGEYLVAGVVKIVDEKLNVVVNEKTKSEHKISIQAADQAHIAAFIGYPVTVNLMLDKKFDGTKGTASAVTKNAVIRIPDPLNPLNDTGFKLIKESECIK